MAFTRGRLGAPRKRTTHQTRGRTNEPPGGGRRVPRAPAQTPRLARLKRAAINGFLIFHLAAILCWSIPVSNPLMEAGRSMVRPYMLWSGLFQLWDMFAPAPKAVNSYLEAIVLYKDGNTRIWAFPRMERLGLVDRYLRERSRKFVENLQEERNASFWPDAARFIARQNNNGPVPVRMVFLVRYWSDIPWRADGKYAAAPPEGHVFYAYTVTPEDFK